MHVKITIGNLTDKQIQSCYDIIVDLYKKSLQEEEKKKGE